MLVLLLHYRRQGVGGSVADFVAVLRGGLLASQPELQ